MVTRFKLGSLHKTTEKICYAFNVSTRICAVIDADFNYPVYDHIINAVYAAIVKEVRA